MKATPQEPAVGCGKANRAHYRSVGGRNGKSITPARRDFSLALIIRRLGPPSARHGLSLACHIAVDGGPIPDPPESSGPAPKSPCSCKLSRPPPNDPNCPAACSSSAGNPHGHRPMPLFPSFPESSARIPLPAWRVAPPRPAGAAPRAASGVKVLHVSPLPVSCCRPSGQTHLAEPPAAPSARGGMIVWKTVAVPGPTHFG